MGRKAPRSGSKARTRKRKTPAGPPLALSPIDLLAGLGPDIELLADDLPPGIAGESPSGGPTPAVTTVAEAGKLLRAGDTTIRRLVRTRGVLAVLTSHNSLFPSSTWSVGQRRDGRSPGSLPGLPSTSPD